MASSESNISQKEEKEVEETAARAASDDTYCAAFVARRRGLARELFAVSSGLIFRQAVVHRDLGVRHFILEHWRSWFLQQMDLLEFYNWLIETEASVMAESHAASGLASATAAIKKHAVVDGMVSDFQAPRFRTLSERNFMSLFEKSTYFALFCERKKTSVIFFMKRRQSNNTVRQLHINNSSCQKQACTGCSLQSPQLKIFTITRIIQINSMRLRPTELGGFNG